MVPIMDIVKIATKGGRTSVRPYGFAFMIRQKLGGLGYEF